MRKVFVLLLGAGLLAALVLGGWVLSLRDRRWADLEARVESLRRDLVSAPLARVPLGRALVPGNAWDDYLAADPHIRGTPFLTIGGKIAPWLRGEAGSSRSEVEALLIRFDASIERIRSGTRRDTAKAPTPMKGLAIQDAIDLCIAKARLLAEGGETAAALDLLVDVALCGRDIAAARSSGAATTGIHIMTWAFRELMFLMRTLEIPRSELQRLETILQALDDRFPDTSDDLLADLLELGDLLQQEDRANQERLQFSDGKRSRRSWRYFFSTRLQAASQFAAAEDLVRRALELKGKPWSVEGPGNRALNLEVLQSKDRLVAYSLSHLAAAQWGTMTRGQLRLIRVGLHYQATGEVLALDDPAGGPIRSRLTERSARFWRWNLYGNADWVPKPGPASYDDTLTLELPLSRP